MRLPASLGLIAPRSLAPSAPLLALALASAPLGCAGKAESPLMAPAAGKSDHARVVGEHPEATALCESLADATHREQCRTIAHGRRFDRQALSLCGETARTRPPQTLACLRMTAQRHYTARSLATCRDYEGDRRIDCLEVLADRRLADTQVAECRAHERPGKQLRCLRRQRDHVFDLEMLHRVAMDAASIAPQLEPIPEIPPHAPIPEDVVVEARARVQLHNQAQMRDLFARAREGVAEAFPTVELEPLDQDMVFNFAGGALGHYQMLYCSRREYLIVFGTPTGVNGFSGRYQVDVHDWTMAGEMRTHRVNDLTPTVYAPGSWARLLADDAKIYSAEPSTYMLEYARGWISSAFDFGVTAPARNMSRDFYNMRKQVRSCLDTAIPNQARQRRRMRRLAQQGRAERREIDRELREARRAP